MEIPEYRGGARAGGGLRHTILVLIRSVGVCDVVVVVQPACLSVRHPTRPGQVRSGQHTATCQSHCQSRLCHIGVTCPLSRTALSSKRMWSQKPQTKEATWTSSAPDESADATGHVMRSDGSTSGWIVDVGCGMWAMQNEANAVLLPCFVLPIHAWYSPYHGRVSRALGRLPRIHCRTDAN